MIKRYLNIFFVFCFQATALLSQEMLSLEKSIQAALQKNYNVLISKNELELTKLQNSFANAGLSPTVSVNSNFNLSNLDSYQEFNNGTTQDRDGARSTGFNASVNASWTIFDGFRMFAIKKRLDQNEKLSALQLKQQMEQLVYDVMVAYFNCVKITQQIRTTQQNLVLNEERRKLAQLKFDIGSDSKSDLLLASTEVNLVKSNLIELEIQLLAAKLALSNLINSDVQIDFSVSDSIQFIDKLALTAIEKLSNQKNSQLLISKNQEEILRLGVKESRANSLPFLQLNTGYNFMRNQSEAGFVFLNKQNGLNASIVAGWTIFNGGQNNRLVKEKEINVLNQQYLYQQTLQRVNSEMFIYKKNLLLALEMVELEQQNLKNARELYQLFIVKYKIGKSTFIETIDMQRRYEEIQTRHLSALYNAKIAETQLLKVSGELVK